jgi:hypothetical protein
MMVGNYRNRRPEGQQQAQPRHPFRDRAHTQQMLQYTPVGSIATTMSHTIREKEKLLKRIRRVRGQVEAVERALEAERPCGDVLQLIAAAVEP